MNGWPVRPAILALATGAVDPAAVPPGLRLGRRVDFMLAKTDPTTGAPLPLLPCPYATLLFGEDGRDMPPVDGPVLAGEQHIVKPGDGDLLVMMLVQRRAGLGRQSFRERWLHGHAPFGLRTAASGYRQLHPCDEPGPDGFDGAGLVFFRDPRHVASARSAPEIARDATLDEMEFIDHGRSMLAMFEFDRT